MKEQALKNLDAGNYNTATVGAGAVKNSVILRMCGNNPCQLNRERTWGFLTRYGCERMDMAMRT
jgi:hypothetical protein